MVCSLHSVHVSLRWPVQEVQSWPLVGTLPAPWLPSPLTHVPDASTSNSRNTRRTAAALRGFCPGPVCVACCAGVVACSRSEAEAMVVRGAAASVSPDWRAWG